MAKDIDIHSLMAISPKPERQDDNNNKKVRFRRLALQAQP